MRRIEDRPFHSLLGLLGAFLSISCSDDSSAVTNGESGTDGSTSASATVTQSSSGPSDTSVTETTGAIDTSVTTAADTSAADTSAADTTTSDSGASNSENTQTAASSESTTDNEESSTSESSSTGEEVDPCPGSIIYVDADAVGSDDGTSWANAYTSVFVATQNANMGDEIWIAEGNYTSVAATAPVAVLQTCVDIYGGFAGTEAAVDERPSPLLVTTLQGDYLGDDEAMGFDDNAYQVVVAMDVDSVRIDGVTVTHGRAVEGIDSGGGFYIESSAITFVDVTVSDNSAYRHGAGLYATYSNLTFVRPRFTGNSQLPGGPSGYGGGLYLAEVPSSLVLDEPTFENNATSQGGGGISAFAATVEISGGHFEGNSTTADNDSAEGGAIRVRAGSAIVTGTSFIGNSSANAGAMSVSGSDSSLVLSDAVFTGNTAVEEGGALRLGQIMPMPYFPATLDQVQFVANTATLGGALHGSGIDLALDTVTFEDNVAQEGGGIYVEIGTIDATASVFDGNQANAAGQTTGGGAIRAAPANIAATDCLFIGNTAEVGGAVLAEANQQDLDTLELTDTTFSYNVANNHGGAAYLTRMIATTNGGSFDHNSAGGSGGALRQSDQGSHAFDGVEFTDNSAGGSGGAVLIVVDSAFSDVLFANNTAASGGAAWLSNTEIVASTFLDNAATLEAGALSSAGVVEVRDSTFTGNTADGDGGAVYVSYQPTLASCAFAGNSAGGNGGAVYSDNAQLIVRNSAFSGSDASSGGAIFAMQAGFGSSHPRVRSSSFYQNSAMVGGGGVEVVNAGDSEGLVVNSAFWNNTGTDIVGAPFLEITYTCSQDFLVLGDGNVFGIPNPFVVGPNGELFLSQNSSCIDAGDDATANTDYGVDGLDWEMMTTSLLGDLDDGTVDMGVHYEP